MTEEEALEQYERLAKRVAKHYSDTLNNEYEDLLQAANLGVIDGIRTYDDTKGASLFTHVYNRVLRAVRSSCRHNTGLVHVPYKSAPVEDREPLQRTELPEHWEEHTESENSIELTERRIVLQAAMEMLDPRERLVINMLFFNQSTYEEIGKSLGTTRQTAFNITQKALSKLRDSLQDQGIPFDLLMVD